MKNSIIFASSTKDAMSDYNIHLNDELVTKAEKVFGTEDIFKKWLQKKVEEWLQAWFNDSDTRTMFSDKGLSDEELAERLKDLPSLTQDCFPQIKKSDYLKMVKANAGRLPKGLEKWL